MSQTLAIEPTRREDRDGILAISAGVGVFTEEEVATVDELLGDYFSKGPEASGYNFLTCRDADRIIGYACYGPRSLTQGAYDLYWIATDRATQGRGIGRAISERAASEVRRLGGRLLIAETSGKADYAATRAFYERAGYTAEAIIRDFYEVDDDLYIYVLRV